MIEQLKAPPYLNNNNNKKNSNVWPGAVRFGGTRHTEKRRLIRTHTYTHTHIEPLMAINIWYNGQR